MMCVYSMVMESMLTPPWRWSESTEWQKHYEDFLKRAKEYDEKTNQPDCELDDKKRQIQELANKFGIKIKFPDANRTKKRGNSNAKTKQKQKSRPKANKPKRKTRKRLLDE